MSNYEAKAIEKIIDSGPSFIDYAKTKIYKIRVVGKDTSKYLDVTEDELRQIAEILN
jgi:hypothetical protein